MIRVTSTRLLEAIWGGYELLPVRISNGVTTDAYEDFMTGFVNPDGTISGLFRRRDHATEGAFWVADDTSHHLAQYIGRLLTEICRVAPPQIFILISDRKSRLSCMLPISDLYGPRFNQNPI